MRKKPSRGQPATEASSGVDPKNRLNDLDSQRWLTFQKSWFVFAPGERTTGVTASFIEFFTKKIVAPDQPARIGLLQENAAFLQPLVAALGRQPILFDNFDENAPFLELDYCLFDLSEAFTAPSTYLNDIALWQARFRQIARHLKINAYATVFVRNRDDHGQLVPIAWQFARTIGQILTLKDEKIGCENDATSPAAQTAPQEGVWCTRQNAVYCLNFRREESSPPPDLWEPRPITKRQQQPKRASALKTPESPRSAWLIVKPPPREKGVLLHPAKFPETLVEIFLNDFSQPGDRIFDPMAGTGSTLLAALARQREAYGIELTPQFHRIARERITRYLPSLPNLLESSNWKLVCGDAAEATNYTEFPPAFDYIITSPPYWDMLRMKGAETQQKRKDAGLLQFYSDDARDLGNVTDYRSFLDNLVKIYRFVATRLAPGSYFTIIVKNVKKRGVVFPLAWDLALQLSDELQLCHEQFWCQDDQKLAPFGYRYAWVSNTFHHYCLHFRKP